jgi:hypothetical protein
MFYFCGDNGKILKEVCEVSHMTFIKSELIQAGGRTVHSEICKFINSFWNKEELPQQGKESGIVPIYKKGDKTDSSNY